MIEEANDARRPLRIGSTVRRQASPFFLFDSGFLANSRWRRLAKRLTDPDDFNSAVGAFVVALAASRSNGLPDLDVREETDSRFVNDLIAVGLLTPTGFPEKPWREYAPSRPKRPNELAASYLNDVTSVTSVTNGDESDETRVPSFPLPSIRRDSPTKTKKTTGYPIDGADHDALDTYHELTGWRPWGAFSGDKLRTTINDFGNAAVEAALHAAHADDPDRKTLLDRTLAALAREAERAKLDRPPKAVRSAAEVAEADRHKAEVQKEARKLAHELAMGGK